MVLYFTAYAPRTPTYPDEISILKLNGRYVWDLGKFSSLYPFCESAQSVSYPTAIAPIAWLNHVLVSWISNPSQMRVFGIATFLTFLLGLLLSLAIQQKWKQIFLDSGPRIIGIALLGVSPAMFHLLRSEMFMSALLSVLLFFSLLVVKSQKIRNFWLGVFLLSFFCLLSGLFLFQHPKALFFLPLLAVLGWQALRPFQFSLRLIFVGHLGVIAISSYYLLQLRLNCPEMEISKVSALNTYLNPIDFFSKPADFLFQFFRNLFGFYEYFTFFTFSSKYMADWFPGTKMPDHSYFFYPLNFVMVGTLIIMSILILAQAFKRLFLSKNWMKEDPISLALLFLFFLLTGLQTTKNFYELGITLPLLCFLSLMNELQPSNLYKFRPHGQPKFALSFASLVSLSLICLMYLLHSSGTYEKSNYLTQKEYKDFTANEELQKIQHQCFGEESPKNRVVVDDLTYFLYLKTENPIFVTYILNQATLMKTAEPALFIGQLHEIKTEGVFIRCSQIPKEFYQKLNQFGNICCISSREIKEELAKKSQP